MPKSLSKRNNTKRLQAKGNSPKVEKLSKQKSVSLRHIAEKAGVSRTTVSLALRKHPRISAKTIKRISEIANELGYRPDAKLNKVMAQLGRKKREEAVLGFIRNNPEDEWDYLEKFVFDEARKYADQLGYRVEPFRLLDPKTSPQKVNQVMYHRGVEGLILSMLHPKLFNLGERTLPIDWEKFSVVQIADTITEEPISGVRHNHFGGILRALGELEALGYERIGLCMESPVDRRTHHRWTAGYLLWHQMRNMGEELHPYFPLNYDGTMLRQWAEQTAIDAIVSPGVEVLEHLKKEGIRFPEDMGFASLHLWGKSSQSATGMDQKLKTQVRIAVDILVSLIHQQSQGILENPILATEPGTWHHGTTTRKPGPNHRVTKLDDEPVRFPPLRTAKVGSPSRINA